MAAGTGKDGNQYEWQSWPPDSLEGMPPKRRRLAEWALFFWFVLLGGLLGSALEAVGVPQPWRALLVLAVLAAVFVPLIRAAVLETRQLRAEGIELPSYSVTRKSLIAAAVITGVPVRGEQGYTSPDLKLEAFLAVLRRGIHGISIFGPVPSDAAGTQYHAFWFPSRSSSSFRLL
ncbi:hypothetical protein [Arthrobacter sp. NPDC093139]|uniref:hypothetical protein n=1 Tax=Arthrobacter sp. NPDC093139 TaxID=3363945 RepID=UPI0037FADBDB